VHARKGTGVSTMAASIVIQSKDDLQRVELEAKSGSQRCIFQFLSASSRQMSLLNITDCLCIRNTARCPCDSDDPSDAFACAEELMDSIQQNNMSLGNDDVSIHFVSISLPRMVNGLLKRGCVPSVSHNR
jgi:hypothetical protein